jgi:hypothetical protein
LKGKIGLDVDITCSSSWSLCKNFCSAALAVITKLI